MSLLKSVGDAITKLPSDFTPHRQIKKIYEARREMIETGEGAHRVGQDRDEW
jgi:2-oxoglutarate dehydrogenase E1 component